MAENVPDADPAGTPAARKIRFLLGQLEEGKYGYDVTIQRAAKLSFRQTKRAVESLEAAGLIEFKKKRCHQCLGRGYMKAMGRMPSRRCQYCDGQKSILLRQHFRLTDLGRSSLPP